MAEQKDESRQDTAGAYEGPAEAVALRAEVTASGDPRSSWGEGVGRAGIAGQLLPQASVYKHLQSPARDRNWRSSSRRDCQ